jgi:uncharacterized membrane protein
MMTKRVLPILALAAVLAAGCGSDDGAKVTDPGDGNPATPTYTANVRPIVQAGCSCHQAGGQMFGSAPLDTYARVFQRRALIRQKVFVDRSMPQGGGISDAQRETIRAWVDGGAPE